MTTRHTTNNGVTARSEPSFADDWNSPEDRVYDSPRPALSSVEQVVVAVVLTVLLARLWRWW